MIFDTHVHLNDEKISCELDTNIKNAINKGINKFLCVGWDIESSKKAIEIAHKYECVYVAIGIIPTEWRQYKDDTIAEFEKLINDEKIIAIGEIGLDYYWEKDDEIVKIQKEMFKRQIELANKYNLPILIHCRNAYNDCLNIIKKFHVKRKSIMHCYSGSLEMARLFIKENFAIAFGGVLTFKNSIECKNVFDNLDINDIVFETDAPYLSPVPYRGKTNKPEYIYETVKYAANRKNMDFEEFSNIVYENTLKLFSRE